MLINDYNIDIVIYEKTVDITPSRANLKIRLDAAAHAAQGVK